MVTTPLLMPIILPLVGSALAFIASIWGLRRIGWAAAIAGVGAGLAAMLRIATEAWQGRIFPIREVVGGWSAETGIIIALDGTGAVIAPVLYGTGFLILLYALGEKRYSAVFPGVFAIAVAGMGGVVLAGDLFNLFVFFEILSLCAVILIAFERRGRAMYAALRYLVVAAVSIAFYLTGLLLLYRVTGELAVDRIITFIAMGRDSIAPENMRAATIGMGCILGACATRVAIVPFHGWLPAAHGEAPTPVSALLSGLMLKSGLLALWRVSTIARILAPTLLETLMILGAVSAVTGAYAAFVQTDVKRLLAFSSISQMGFIITALAAGAYQGALHHAVAHALYKSLLFLVIGLSVSRHGTHDLQRLREQRSTVTVGGINRYLEPLVFLVGAMAVMGVPGLGGFAGKELIGAGLVAAGQEGVPRTLIAYRVLGIASIGTIATFLRLSTLYVPLRFVRPDAVLDRPITDPAPGRVSRALRAASVTTLALIVIAHGLYRLDLVSARAAAGYLTLFVPALLLLLLSRPAGVRRVLTRVALVRPGVDAVLVLVLVGMIVLIR